jgi:hypothetical protein
MVNGGVRAFFVRDPAHSTGLAPTRSDLKWPFPFVSS